ncbi:unnamed protein product [Caenorhabditis brenneri]
MLRNFFGSFFGKIVGWNTTSVPANGNEELQGIHHERAVAMETEPPVLPSSSSSQAVQMEIKELSVDKCSQSVPVATRNKETQPNPFGTDVTSRELLSKKNSEHSTGPAPLRFKQTTRNRGVESPPSKRRCVMPEDQENVHPTYWGSPAMPTTTRGNLEPPSSNFGINTSVGSSSTPTTRELKILKVSPTTEDSPVSEVESVNEKSELSTSDVIIAQNEVPANAAPVVYKRRPNQPTKHAEFWFPRSYNISVGINRQPNHIPLPESCAGIVCKFKIQEDPNFPESVGIARTILREEQREVSNVAEYPDDRSSNSVLGVAALEDYLGPTPDQDYMDRNGKEELMWSPTEFEEHAEQHGLNQDEFYQTMKKKYLFPIWRQFEGRISQEHALCKLKSCDYDIAKALESIDELLKILPQKLKEPSLAQAQVLRDQLRPVGDGYNLRDIQDYVMRNYHMSEVFNFYSKFKRFYGKDDDRRELKGDGLTGQIACNCAFEECRELNFEPRYGCSNCTKTLRRNQLPAEKLCLICTTYTEITEETRPAVSVVFDQEDLEKIKLWDQRCPELSREEFEKWDQNQKNEKYRNLELTQEEVLMLHLEQLVLENDSKKNTKGPTLGEQVCSMLQPVVLPHFPICQCIRSGSIPTHSPDYGKTAFLEEEVHDFVAAISATPGDITAAARTLGKQEELVEIFLRTYNARHNIWDSLPSGVTVHKYPRRKVHPTINPAPVIPKTGTVQKFE